jgi:hypothetical protein
MGNRRVLVSVCLAVGLAVSACGGASPTGTHGPGGSHGLGNVGSTLPTGLASNLGNLASYQFSESIPRSSAPSGASSAASGASPAASIGSLEPLLVSGTVVNTPPRALLINRHPVQFIVIGDQAWRSADGLTWTVGDATDTMLLDLLPGHDYPMWFDAKASYFRAVGDELKNGVQCVHYKGDASLAGLYSGNAGAEAVFQAELWIAKDGDYPVSGVYGFIAPSNSLGWSWGFSFDVTNPNDASNRVTEPSNVVPLPS